MEARTGSRREAYRTGLVRGFGVPGFVLFASFFGFGAFARATGLDTWQALFMTASVFALPGQVVLVDQISAGAGLAAATVAVTLTAVRLLPMTVSILPILREPGQSVLTRVVLSHFVAVTVWVESMRRLPDVERHCRVPYYFGLVSVIWPLVMIATALGHVVAGDVPVPASAALLLLTPFYFLLSAFAAARERLDWLAVGAGLCLGPFFHVYAPGLDLLWTGLVGGTFAWLLARRSAS